ncbi:P-loop containing nucleoside triphosphate hydrolase protein [Mycena belliarum]|uniref:DNA 3'-5' helicase n=1 Tax=Mycena belliarum TaxID=1033014 RepID=A0AAD6U4Y4_9AGAR|nr:P-loop containing nucleoside triphosphate hydrolase protein [Mycena belliae]
MKAIREELKLLPELIKANYKKWRDGPKKFQLECMEAQKLGQDVLLHAATGAGKTGIAAGPHLLPSSKGKVTLVVSPLLSLHQEQVTTFQEEFGLTARAINSANGGCTKAIMAVTIYPLPFFYTKFIWLQSVIAGEFQIVILSPEMLLSRKFIDGVLKKPEFGSRCLSVFIDEAHCVSHWGDSFRKKYASIGIVRAFLPRATPIIAVTATLTPRVHQDLLTKLQFDPHNYTYCSVGNDRPNVTQIIRALQHPANSYRDIDFMVRPNSRPQDIKKAFLYTDDIKDGGKIIDHLNARVHTTYRARGLVRPYNAAMSPEYRAQVMSLFKAGIVRVLVCTDAAGMGCDIPDIELVVQWKKPKNVSSWVQRAGRAARAHGSTGMAVMLVEKTAFEVGAASVVEAAAGGPSRGGSRGGRGGSNAGRGRGGRGRGAAAMAKRGKDYAISHGAKRGSYNGSDDAKPDSTPEDVADIPWDSPDEGLYALIQATICRRRVFRHIDGCSADVPPIDCCDICNPKLFDLTRPAKPVRATRQKGIRRGPAVDSVRTALFLWRRNIKKMHYPGNVFAPHALLDDATCELLASVGPVESMERLEQLLGSSWSLWDRFGVPLYVYLRTLDIPPLPPPPPRTRKAPSAPPFLAIPPPETPAQIPNKRAHSSHSTSQDTAAPAPQRRRQGLETPSPVTFEAQAPLRPRPQPRRRPVAQQPSTPHTQVASTSFQAPHLHTPSPHHLPQNFPSTPLRTSTIPAPSTYPGSSHPQPYGPLSHYQPYPGMYYTPPAAHYYPYPYPYGPPASNPPPHIYPPPLAQNPYAPPAFAGSPSPLVGVVSHSVTSLPPPAEPPAEASYSVFPSQYTQNMPPYEPST